MRRPRERKIELYTVDIQNMTEMSTFLFILMVIMTVMRRGEAQLRENFYSSTCPNVENIVLQAVNAKLAQTGTFTPIPATLRLFFHDCFVEV